LTLTEDIAKYISETDFDDLPSTVVSQAKRCLLDSIGCMLGGYAWTEIGKIMVDFAKSAGGKPEATVVGSGDKTWAGQAAFTNAALANGLDYDDTPHIGAVIVPTVFGVGERENATGKDVITALVVGYDVAFRVLLFLNPIVHRTRNVWDDGTLETYGAVASASKLLGLDPVEINGAMGIVYRTAPMPDARKTRELGGPRSPIKSSFGWAAHCGIVAAILAQKGLKGTMNAFDGNLGFWKMTSEPKKGLSNITDRLGEKFMIEEIDFKPYPCCRHLHAPLDALNSILSRGIQPKNIKRLTVKTKPLLANEHYDIRHPQSMTDAQFSVPFTIAALSAHGTLTPEHFLALNDREVHDLMSRTVIEADSGLKDDEFAAAVRVELQDGSVYEEIVTHPRGSPQNPLSDDEISQKFKLLAKKAIGSKKASELMTAISAIDKVKKVSEITSLLS
jgi:2-methylcitrate dehydratase PrpD